MQRASIVEASMLAPAEKKQILEQTERIAESKFFRTSSRYPSFLRYVVDRSLAGFHEDLKERTIGVQIFNRSADYDTANDPVVRVSAGEVRKRIAQFYQQEAPESLRIEIPIGSYTPKYIRLCPIEESVEPESSIVPQAVVVPSPNGVEAVVPETVAATRVPVEGRWKPSWLFYTVCALCLLGVAVGVGIYRVLKPPRIGPPGTLFSPLLKKGGSILICLEDRNPANSAAADESVARLNSDHEQIPYSTVFTTEEVSQYLLRRGGEPEVEIISRKTYPEIREMPSILIANVDNPWVQRILEPLPYRLELKGSVVSVVDENHAGGKSWSVNMNLPLSQLQKDYGIIARIQDPDTRQPFIVLASMTDRAAFAIGRMLRFNPQMFESPDVDWSKPNVEMIISITVANGYGGLPHIEAVKAW